jgi:hypothetical protein
MCDSSRSGDLRLRALHVHACPHSVCACARICASLFVRHSALDSESERLVRDAMDKLMDRANRTLLVRTCCVCDALLVVCY